MSFIVQVLQWPTGIEPNSSDQTAADAPSDSISLDSIVLDLHSYLCHQERIASQKLSIMAAALRMACLPQMRCTAKDAQQRGERMMRQRQKWIKKQKMQRQQLNESMEEENEADEEPLKPFFDLHKVMGTFRKALTLIHTHLPHSLHSHCQLVSFSFFQMPTLARMTRAIFLKSFDFSVVKPRRRRLRLEISTFKKEQNQAKKDCHQYKYMSACMHVCVR